MHSDDKLTISPGHPLRGSIELPGDKSISHRCAILAAMSQGTSEFDNFLVAGVTKVMLTALGQLGVDTTIDDKRLTICSPGIDKWRIPDDILDCGNSATTLRLLAGALAAAGISAVLDGSPGLRRRPMDRIVQPLKQMGVPVEISSTCGAPLVFQHRLPGKSLSPITYRMPVASAQVKSCLLLAALAADGTTIIQEPGPSRDHTERLLVSLGIKLDSWNQNGEYFSSLQPPPKVCFKPFYRRIPADLSAAAFLIVAALITPGSEIILKNVGLNPTRTGLIDVLWEMGAQIEIKSTQSSAGEPCGNLIVRHSHLHGVDVSGFLVVRMIDEFPAFAIAAAFADGDSRVMDAGELRLKESDRIGQLVSGLSDLGIGAEETADGFVIHGGRLPTGGEVDSHNDHRLAMAFALSGLSGGAPVTVTGSNVIAESFPEFASALQHLGADTHEGREK